MGVSAWDLYEPSLEENGKNLDCPKQKQNVF